MCPSRFPRNNRVVTKPPFPDVPHPLGAPLHLQSFGTVGKAVADANGFLRCGHGGGGHKAGEEQHTAERLHGSILSLENYASPRGGHCTTRTGVSRLIVVPSPSWPALLSPQQEAAPAAVTPQVCESPARTAANVTPPDTSAGVNRKSVVPSPSWPELL